MALVDVLKDRSMMDLFKNTFPVQRMPRAEVMPAPPLTKKYSMIGMAFDYLVRFHTKRAFPEAVEERWVAEGAVDLVKRDSGEYLIVDGDVMPWNKDVKPEEQYPDARRIMRITSPFNGNSQQWADYLPTAEDALNRAKKLRDDFIETGSMTRELIKSTLDLATLDLIVRTGRMFPMPSATEDDIADMENLFHTMMDSGLLRPKRRAFLNPTFGKGSALVGGADADLIIDDTLIDIKTTKSNSFTQNMYNQLLGYYALSTFRDEFSKITHLGIYFSRYGVIVAVPAPDEDAAQTIIGWFEKHSAAKAHARS